MQFSVDALDELREIYRAEFGEEITRDQAVETASRLLNLIKLLARPLPERSNPAEL